MSTGTTSLAAAYRKRRQQGTVWEAPSGATFRIRKLSLTDQAVVGKLPDNLQQVVYKAIDASTKLKAAPNPDDVDIDDVFGDLSGKEKLDAMHDTSVRLAKLGWLEPKLVDAVQDEDTELSVDEVDDDDLLAYMAYVLGGQQVEAGKVATFLGGSSGGVGPVLDSQGVQPAPERPVRDASVGILRSDAV